VTAWTVLAVDRVVDGDSLRLTRQRIVGEVDGLTITATDSAPVPVRLVHVDTPERGEVGWARARDDLIAWVLANEWRGLTLHDAGRDNFGRILGDLHAPEGDTASLHLIRDKGWPTWMETR
jgi:endonuclease YncB( thermonuclease family)